MAPRKKKAPALKAVPKMATPTRIRLTQSQQIVLTTAAQQANQIQANAIAVVCTEHGLAMPGPDQPVRMENGELVIG